MTFLLLGLITFSGIVLLCHILMMDNSMSPVPQSTTQQHKYTQTYEFIDSPPRRQHVSPLPPPPLTNKDDIDNDDDWEIMNIV